MHMWVYPNGQLGTTCKWSVSGGGKVRQQSNFANVGESVHEGVRHNLEAAS